jgi:predicted DNA-binding transcriptional regulator AlpA
MALPTATYKPADVRRRLNIDDNTMYRMIERKALPRPIKLGTAKNSPLRFVAEEVDAAIDAMRGAV